MIKWLTVAAGVFCSTAFAQAMESAEFFTRDKARNWKSEIYEPVAYKSLSARKTSVRNKVIRRIREKLGHRWVKIGLKIAKLESNFNCRAVGPRTRHGRAKGVFQVIHKSARALGYNKTWKLTECDYGIAAGVAHMQACLDSGVRTDRQMASCHVSGVYGWKIRLAKRSERYKQKYIRLALNGEG